MSEPTSPPTIPAAAMLPISYQVAVRFRDVDAMGHVNNATYVTFLEEARWRMWHEHIRPATDARDLPFIVARVEIDYTSPIHLLDVVTVQLGITRIGTRSFTIRYAVHAGQRRAATAQTVQVYYDYGIARPAEIPDEIRARLELVRATAENL